MTLQQLLIIRETMRCGLNLTEVAASLSTAQSGISKHIRDLEHELGVKLFVRKGKRLIDFTESGRAILPYVETALLSLANIRTVADQLVDEQLGEIRIATTHTQSRFVLPPIIERFRRRFQSVRIVLLQTTPPEIQAMLRDNHVDIGIATEAISTDDDIVTYPFYHWKHVALVRADHQLVEQAALSEIAEYPLITYQRGFTGRSIIDRAFIAARLKPQIVMEAMDADVIKEYVRLGMGVGLVAEMAIDTRDKDLRCVSISSCFPSATSLIAVRRDRFLRSFVFRFIAACRPDLDEIQLQEVAKGGSQNRNSPTAPKYEDFITLLESAPDKIP